MSKSKYIKPINQRFASEFSHLYSELNKLESEDSSTLMKSIDLKISSLPSVYKVPVKPPSTISKFRQNRISAFITSQNFANGSSSKSKLSALLQSHQASPNSKNFSFASCEEGDLSTLLPSSKRKFGETYYSARASPVTSRFPSIYNSPTRNNKAEARKNLVRKMIKKMIEDQLGIFSKTLDSTGTEIRRRKTKDRKYFNQELEQLNEFELLNEGLEIDKLMVEKIVVKQHEKDWRKKIAYR